MKVKEIPIPCMPLQMEISLDGSFETPRKMRIKEEQNHQTLKEENKEFFDAQEGKEKNKTHELSSPKLNRKDKQGDFIGWG